MELHLNYKVGDRVPMIIQPKIVEIIEKDKDGQWMDCLVEFRGAQFRTLIEAQETASLWGM